GRASGHGTRVGNRQEELQRADLGPRIGRLCARRDRRCRSCWRARRANEGRLAGRLLPALYGCCSRSEAEPGSANYRDNVAWDASERKGYVNLLARSRYLDLMNKSLSRQSAAQLLP